jgi:(1->4)-alpha-D-glucan 1-alpha-D-glucosylmutase
VEKILAADERLPAHWPTVGTTGYEFANRAEDLFISPHGLRRITRYWAESTGLPSSFEQVARAAKRRALEDLLAPDVERVVATLRESAHGVSATSLRRAVVETIVDLPVYRAYLDRDARRLLPESRVRVERALASVVARAQRATVRAAAEHLSRTLLTDASLVKRFGQVSGPAAAKGIEDTAFYIHVPLASRNEVGADPGRLPNDAVAEMHRQSAERARRSPGSMLAVTTHDTKRSADARARLDVLSEVAGDWIAAVERWRAWNARLLTRGRGARLPDPNTEYLLYQSLVALWPMHGADAVPYSVPSHAQLDDLRQRLGGYTEKAAREAGRMTSWTRPNARFERALHALVDEMLSPSCPPYEDRFVRDVTAFVARVARPGLWSSLARTVLQLCAPGVPDVYQGDELWTFSLVDPDNRRPVDFDARRALLADVRAGTARGAQARMAFLASLAEHPEDGRIKLYTIHRLLGLRRCHADLFAGGAYVPLAVEGAAAGHVLAFARTVAGKVAVVAVPRLVLTLTGDPFAAPLGAIVWEATEVVVPQPLGRRAFTSVLTGTAVRGRAHGRARVAIDCGELFNELPVAVIVTT